MSVAENRLVDQSAGLELVTGDEIALEATRHIFLAGDLLDPARKRDVGFLEGGEEIPNRCLRRTAGRLPRCSITPLEVWGQDLPLEQFPEGVRPMKLKGSEPQPFHQPVGLVTGGNPKNFNAPLFFVPVYPGELIIDAIGIASGDRRGIVEIIALQGVEYGKEDREMQELFFPADYIKPIEIRLIRQHIEQIGESVVDPDVKSVAADMLTSCDQFTEYAMDQIGKANTQVLQRVHPQGHTYTYSPKIRSFAAQLEVKLIDTVGQRVQDQVAQAVATVDPALLEQVTIGNSQMLERIATMFTDALKQAVATVPAQPAPPPPATKGK